MSGSAIPYHLRPHKAVDRRLFVDLLVRYERWRTLGNAAYVSMGAYPLEDHKLVHRLLGITRLLTFDGDPAIVARQRFNKPIDSTACVPMLSGALIDDFDETLEANGIDDADGVVVWLDYTDPKKIAEQIREFETLLDKLTVGDVVRITVNAHPQAYNGPKPAVGKPMDKSEIEATRFENLKKRVGDYLPASAKAEDMTAAMFPSLLAKCFGQAVLNAFPPSVGRTFAPLSIVRYADGQQMLSVTGCIVARSDEIELRKRLDLASWKFASNDWNTVHGLTVPDLTLRERLYLERSIGSKSLPDIQNDLEFDFDEVTEMPGFLKNYAQYYRFYPSLLAAEL